MSVFVPVTLVICGGKTPKRVELAFRMRVVAEDGYVLSNVVSNPPTFPIDLTNGVVISFRNCVIHLVASVATSP